MGIQLVFCALRARGASDLVHEVGRIDATDFDEIVRLEQLLNTYRMQGSEIDQSLRELQEDNLQLTEENKAYAAQVEALEKQEKTLQDKISALEIMVCATPGWVPGKCAPIAA